MVRCTLALAIALLIFSCPMETMAQGKGGGGGGGGGGKGGANKPLTVRYVGIITNLQPTPNGVIITVGTSYYAVGSALITADTKIKLNGSSGATVFDLRLGDTAQIDLLWPSRVATKIEVIGGR